MFNGHRVSVWDDENVVEMLDGNGCTTLHTYLMPLNCTLRSGDNGSLCYVYITTIKKKYNSSGSGKALELLYECFIHLFGNRFW